MFLKPFRIVRFTYATNRKIKIFDRIPGAFDRTTIRNSDFRIFSGKNRKKLRPRTCVSERLRIDRALRHESQSQSNDSRNYETERNSNRRKFRIRSIESASLRIQTGRDHAYFSGTRKKLKRIRGKRSDLQRLLPTSTGNFWQFISWKRSQRSF